MYRFFPVLLAFVLALCVASPVFADDVAASSSVASSVPVASSSVASSVPVASSSSVSSSAVASSAVSSSSVAPAPATIIEKPLSEYTPTEGLLLVVCVQLVLFLLIALVKWRFV